MYQGLGFALLTLSQLKTFLLAEHASHTVYPSSEYSIYDSMFLSRLPDFKVGNIYSWSRFTPLDEVKVVILGQVSFCFH
jgi:uracil-DNA glycosylase